MKNRFDISAFVDVRTTQAVLADLVTRVKTRRKEARLSQKELAVRSGVSYASLRRFENTGEIALVSLLKIAQTLSCLEDVDSLFSASFVTSLKEYKI